MLNVLKYVEIVILLNSLLYLLEYQGSGVGIWRTPVSDVRDQWPAVRARKHVEFVGATRQKSQILTQIHCLKDQWWAFGPPLWAFGPILHKQKSCT